jgi:hypothetical protein
MPENFTTQILIDGKTLFAAIVPEVRKNGKYYEVNIKGYPRFFMTWSALGRYDVAAGENIKLPYALVLAVSDAIEKEVKKK